MQLKWSYALAFAILLGRLLLILYPQHNALLRLDSETDIAIVPALSHPYLNPWQAPYGIIWYAVNIPLNLLNNWLVLTTIVDFGVMMLLAWKRGWLTNMVYVATSILQWRQAPYNLSIMWLTLLGYAWTPLLGISIIAKLPVGSPGPLLTGPVWQFIRHSSQFLSNWRYYGLLGLWWLTVLGKKWNDWDERKQKVRG